MDAFRCGICVLSQKVLPVPCPHVLFGQLLPTVVPMLCWQLSHKVTWKRFFFFWHGLHGNLLIETVMDAVRGGYFLLRALARGLISSHSAIVSGCVRLDNLFHCFELPFHHLYKHLQSIVSSASREHCVKWNLWSQLLLTLGPTGFHKQENTK